MGIIFFHLIIYFTNIKLILNKFIINNLSLRENAIFIRKRFIFFLNKLIFVLKN